MTLKEYLSSNLVSIDVDRIEFEAKKLPVENQLDFVIGVLDKMDASFNVVESSELYKYAKEI